MSKGMKIFPVTVNRIVKTAMVSEIPLGVAQIRAPEFWEKGDRGQGVVIAVIDTGCDINHMDLKERIVGVRNFTMDDGGKADNVTDYCGHGTHVAGTIAATGNGQGVVGVAPEADLLILKALGGAEGEGKYEWIIAAIHYAVQQKVHIISMSLAGYYDMPELHDAIKEAVAAGILVVCAAGNEGAGNGKGNSSGISYPAYYNEVISVGAVDYNSKATSFTNFNSKIDLVAPGLNIVSTYPDNALISLSGTSMAAPHVSGALALIINWSKKDFGRELTESELYAQLIKRTLTLDYEKKLVGNGILYLDAVEKLEECLNKARCEDSKAKKS